MRARAGAYRILPAPGHVVFMRYTGEDGRRDAEDGAVVRLSGRGDRSRHSVRHLGARGADRLARRAGRPWTGTTRARSFSSKATSWGAVTNVEEERLGSVLYRFGVINQEQHAQIVSATQGGRRFGEAAIELGVLKHDDIYAYIEHQIEEIVFATMTVGDGTFFFLDGFDESRLVSRHTVSANALLHGRRDAHWMNCAISSRKSRQPSTSRCASKIAAPRATSSRACTRRSMAS